MLFGHDLGADALVGVDFQQQRMAQAAVDDVDCAYAFLQRF